MNSERGGPILLYGDEYDLAAVFAGNREVQRLEEVQVVPLVNLGDPPPPRDPRRACAYSCRHQLRHPREIPGGSKGEGPSTFGRPLSLVWHRPATVIIQPNVFSIRLRMRWLAALSCPSNSDHPSPMVSSPTHVTTPPMSFSTASTAARLASQLESDRADLARLDAVAQRVCKPGVVRHVVDAHRHIDEGPEHRMRGYAFDPLAIDPDLAARRGSNPAIALRCGSSAFRIGVAIADWHYRATHKARQPPAARASGWHVTCTVE